jgi:hypothetical protein
MRGRSTTSVSAIAGRLPSARTSDEATVERILAGPVRELLSAQQGLGFEIRIEYGQVIVSRQDFLKRDEDREALVAAAYALARAVRDISVPWRAAQPLATQLPAPEWLAAVRGHPERKRTSWPIGARLDQVVRVAEERGMAVEDPRAFHAAFAAINVPGEPFGVLHGRLPGTALTGRLVCCAERPMALLADLVAFLTDPGRTGGQRRRRRGGRPRRPATAPEGEVDDGLRVAVAGGVLTAWPLRPSWQADGAALDRLAADVARGHAPARHRRPVAMRGIKPPRRMRSRVRRSIDAAPVARALRPATRSPRTAAAGRRAPRGRPRTPPARARRAGARARAA